MSGLPIDTPSTKNSTCAMPRPASAVASAVTVTVPFTVALFTGLVSVTEGGSSLLSTVTVMP